MASLRDRPGADTERQPATPVAESLDFFNETAFRPSPPVRPAVADACRVGPGRCGLVAPQGGVALARCCWLTPERGAPGGAADPARRGRDVTALSSGSRGWWPGAAPGIAALLQGCRMRVVSVNVRRGGSPIIDVFFTDDTGTGSRPFLREIRPFSAGMRTVPHLGSAARRASRWLLPRCRSRPFLRGECDRLLQGCPSGGMAHRDGAD